MAEFTTDQRKQLVIKKEAMPDGSYPIRNASDLKNAIQAYGRSANKPATQAWIKKRAKELNLEDLLPESWKEVKQSAIDSPEGTLSHHGILGQKWGVRRTSAQSDSSPSSKTHMQKKADKNFIKNEKEKLTNKLENEFSKEISSINSKAKKLWYFESGELPGEFYDDNGNLTPKGRSAYINVQKEVGALDKKVKAYVRENSVTSPNKLYSINTGYAWLAGDDGAFAVGVEIFDNKKNRNTMFMSAEEGNELEIAEDFLSHHGILGQKWGVRRSESQLGNSSSKKSEGSEDYQKSKEMLKRGAKNLSTKELKDLTTRLQLEQQYKNLNPSDVKKGMNIVKGITAAGTTVASLYALSKTPLAQDIMKAMKKAG